MGTKSVDNCFRNSKNNDNKNRTIITHVHFTVENSNKTKRHEHD